jgi:TonB family protein
MVSTQKKLLAAFAMVIATAAPVAAQSDGSPLAAARDLYASARYDEALAVLNGLRPTESAERKSIEQYRSLCLLALGRGSEAESAIAAVVTADPLYQPTEASPRVRAAFTDVRQRLLPEIASARYTSAKQAFDRKDWPSAEAQFREVIALLDDPDMGNRLSDLRTLASGFLELASHAAAPPPSSSAPEPKTDPEPAPAPSAPAAPPNRVYVGEDPGVVVPIPIKQDVPRVPNAILSQTRDRGMLELVIDELGRVVNMTIRQSVHPMYDSLLLAAARDWKYQPARVGGQPVKFRKVVQIAVNKRNP